MIKYEFTNESIQFEGRTLHRIKAATSFGDIRKGQLGGFIEKIDNLNMLTQEGNAWVYDNAKVFGNGLVTGNAKVKNNAIICDDAIVGSNAVICDDAKVFEKAEVSGGALIRDRAILSGKAKVFEAARIGGNVQVGGYTKIYGGTELSDNEKLNGYCELCNDSIKKLEEGSIINYNDKFMYVGKVNEENFEAYRILIPSENMSFSQSLHIPNSKNELILDTKYKLKFSGINKVIGSVGDSFKNNASKTIDFLNSKGFIKNCASTIKSLQRHAISAGLEL